MLAIQIIYDQYTPAVEAQITRDLIALKSSYPRATFSVVCASEEPERLLESFGIMLYPKGTTKLTLVYKVADQWPEHPLSHETRVIMRDLYVPEEQITVDNTPRVGYHLPYQGRDIPNQVDLIKRGPNGPGGVDPAILLLWGGPTMAMGPGIW